MANFSQLRSIDVQTALDPIVVNDDTEGTGLSIDTRGAEACMLVAHVGVSGDVLSPTVKHDLILQHADTDADGTDPEAADFTAVTDAQMVVVDDGVTFDEATGRFATIDDAAEDPAVHRIAYVGDKAFVRLVVDTTGAHTNGTPMSALAVLGHLRRSVGGATPV